MMSFLSVSKKKCKKITRKCKKIVYCTYTEQYIYKCKTKNYYTMKNWCFIILTVAAFSTKSIFAQTVKINEFMASNSTTIADPYGDYEDWIELYNYGTDTVDVGGLFITDKLDQPMRHRIPAGYEETKIPPQGFLLLWASNDTLKNGLFDLDFRLSMSGEAVGLFALDGATPIDTIVFGQQVTDISYGRYPDGSDNWVFFNFPTPGTSNSILNVENLNGFNEPVVAYPNPVTDGSISFSEKISFNMYDAQGKFMGTYTDILKLNTKGLRNGYYFIKTYCGQNIKFMHIGH